MRKILLAMLLLLISTSAKAQTRFLVGARGGESFSNTQLGVTASVEIPFAKRFEFDLTDNFSPYENHTALGTGYSNVISGTGTAWFNSFGVSGGAESSGYSVTSVSKSAVYVFGGPVIRKKLFDDFPAVFGFNYIQQVNNGIDSGVETSRLHGGSFTADIRLGCTGKICFRMINEFVVGRVLDQGNPVCDGTFGNGSQVGFSSCPRTAAISGGATISIVMEFPRRKGHEQDLF